MLVLSIEYINKLAYLMFALARIRPKKQFYRKSYDIKS